MDEFFSGCKDGYCPWEYEGVSKTGRDIFCDEYNQYFLQLEILMSSFTKLDHVANVSDLTQRVIFLHKHILENRVLQNSDRKYPRKMMLVWDTGSSYGLTPFRSDFIDCVKCDILVKYVTKVNRFIGIGTTLHKFIKSNSQDIFFSCISYHIN